jgi:hypothetical protein
MLEEDGICRGECSHYWSIRGSGARFCRYLRELTGIGSPEYDPIALLGKACLYPSAKKNECGLIQAISDYNGEVSGELNVRRKSNPRDM